MLTNYFKGKRICRICGINIDIKDLELLKFFHQDCWQEYRKAGLTYEMPAHV